MSHVTRPDCTKEDIDSIGLEKQHSPTLPDEERENEDNARAIQDQDVALTTVETNSSPHSVFSKRKKRFIVLLAAWGGFFSPLSANIYFPALTTLTQEFKVSSTLMNLTLTSYMIFQGLAPTIFGDFTDTA